MRRALRADPQTDPSSTPVSLPAPVGGWNARDPLAAMPITDAQFMVNWFPDATWVKTRRGSDTYASGLSNQVETVFAYAGGANLRILCAVSNIVVNITTVNASGTVGINRTVATGFLNSRFQYTNIGTPGGSFLVAVNGADARQIYDGTNWYAGSASAGSALTIAPSNIALYNRRLFYTETNTLRFLYHNQVNAIGGTVSPFDLSAQMDRGGFLMGVDTWTRDGGNGMDDLICFISSEGQVAVYAGIDPADANNWERLGIYNIPVPMSYRSTAKIGGELAILTESGIVPLSAVVNGLDQAQSHISAKIDPAIQNAVDQYRANWGWELRYFPASSMLILNIPVASGSAQQQYVMNTNTGAWCSFKGWAANTFAVYNRKLYFGASAKVFQADTGTNDDGVDVQNDIKQAASVFNYPGRLKHFKMFRPQIASDGDLPINMGIDVDFSNAVPSNIPSPTPIPLAEWDVATWDDFFWADDVYSQPRWMAAFGIGTWGQVRMTGAVNTESIQWYGTDIVFEPGEIV